MWQKLLVLWISCIAITTYAGTHKLDSLKLVLRHTTQDTAKIKLLITIFEAAPPKDSTAKMQYAFDALAIAKNIHNRKYVMDCYQSIGRIYCYVFKNYQAGIEYFKQYENSAKIYNDTMRQIDALNNLVVVCYYSSAFATGLNFGNKLLQLRPTKEMEATALFNMGLIYLYVADYAKAMKYYTHSLKIAEEALIAKKTTATAEDTMYLALQLLNIGDIYGKMKEYDKAINNYDRAITTAQKDPYVTIMSQMGKGEIFESTNNNVEAIKMYDEALILNRKREHEDNETKIFNALARLYFKTENIVVAQNYSDTALALAQKYGEEAMLPEIYIIRARLDKHGGKYAGAIAYLQNAIKIAREIGILESQSEALQILSETYKAMNRPSEALDAYQQYITIRDSIYNTDKAKEITRMDVESEYTSLRLTDSVKNAQQTAIYEAGIQKQRVINFSAIAVVAMLLLLSFFVYRNYSQQKKANIIISRARDEIQEEKKVSDGLLLNILPEEVAKELKARGDVEPRLFENVTVFFSDFVGFTIAGDKMSPHQLVAELHECFKAFDGIMSRYGIEKIKTVGDAYLAVSGLPEPNANHANDVVKAALEVRNFMAKRKDLIGDKTFGIRIGINSGPVVAGIVGVKKFAYDIWGDTVNVAARMEQNSEDGKINISEKTRELLTHEFALTDRGTLMVKNKGAMSMYFVEEAQVIA